MALFLSSVSKEVKFLPNLNAFPSPYLGLTQTGPPGVEVYLLMLAIFQLLSSSLPEFGGEKADEIKWAETPESFGGDKCPLGDSCPCHSG